MAPSWEPAVPERFQTVINQIVTALDKNMCLTIDSWSLNDGANAQLYHRLGIKTKFLTSLGWERERDTKSPIKNQERL